MQIFKPGKFPIRLASGLTAGAVAICAGLVGWQVAARMDKTDALVLAPEAAAALQHAAFTQAETQPGYARPRNVALEVRPGETLERAVQRAGVTAEEARQAVEALGRAMDTIHIKAGLDFDAAIAQPHGGDRPARLIGLSLRTGPATA